MHRAFKLVPVSQGCYQLHPFHFSLLWICANELPLRDDLLPFLIARSGAKLDEFGLWFMHRCEASTLVSILRYTTMSSEVKHHWWQNMPIDDEKRYPALRKRTEALIRDLYEIRPDLLKMFAESLEKKIEKKIEKKLRKALQTQTEQAARVREAQSLLLAVLKKRGFSLSPAYKQKVLACQDINMLERWHLQAISAKKAVEVFDDP